MYVWQIFHVIMLQSMPAVTAGCSSKIGATGDEREVKDNSVRAIINMLTAVTRYGQARGLMIVQGK